MFYKRGVETCLVHRVYLLGRRKSKPKRSIFIGDLVNRTCDFLYMYSDSPTNRVIHRNVEENHVISKVRRGVRV